MPAELIWLDDGGVILRGSGRMVSEEAVNTNRAMYTPRERIPCIRYQIIDLLAVTEFAVSPQAMRTLADQDTAAAGDNPDMIIAIVMSDQLTYGMNRMYSAYFSGDGEHVALFNDLDTATAWIRERVPEAQC